MPGPSFVAGSDMDPLKHIAIIGLGAMGAPMALHLSRSGYEVTGVDLDPGARDRFPGAVTPQQADFSGVDAVVTMLPEGPQVMDVYQGAILSNAYSGAVLIDCSTIDLETARTLNKLAVEKGFAQIDAPVSGGPEAAGAGELSFMVGGDADHVSLARPLLENLGKKTTHFGAAGSGQAAKACHNMICGITAMAVFEGFALADALQLDADQFYELCAGAAAQSWTLENRCPIPGVVPAAPSSNGYAPGFAARLMAKDLRLAQAAAQISGQVTPFGAEAARAFTRFAEATGGDLDFSSYFTALKQQTKTIGTD